MIKGIGTDIVSIARIYGLLKQHGQRFVEHTLTEKEIEIFNKIAPINQTNHFAKRFAAKEAISKAFGTGIGAELAFTDIEVTNDAKGKPLANIARYPDLKIHLSLSDEKSGYATAFAVVEE